LILPSPPAPPPQKGEGSAPERVSDNSPSPLAGEGLGRGFERPTRKELLERAKWMRANPTEAERRLWSILRAKRLAGFKFKRQLIIDWYIADFVCLARRLIVEADGSQHAEDEDDARRDRHLREQGFRVLRFWNNDIVTEGEAVGAAIHDALTAPLPSPPSAALPSPARGEGLAGALHA
jgi:very-short-patch-repair endonuclease